MNASEASIVVLLAESRYHAALKRLWEAESVYPFNETEVALARAEVHELADALAPARQALARMQATEEWRRNAKK